jgi:hypothetical protein
MRILSKIALAASILVNTCAAKAEWVSGYGAWRIVRHVWL